MWNHLFPKIALPILCTAIAVLATESSAAPVWRIDFQLTSGTTPPPPPIMAGDEPRAATLDPLFALSDPSLWAAIDAPPGPSATPDAIPATNAPDTLSLFRNNSVANAFSGGGPTTGPQIDDRLDRDGLIVNATPTFILNFTMPKSNHPYRFAIYDNHSSNFTISQYLLNGVVAGDLADNDAETFGADAPLITTALTDNTGLVRLTVQLRPGTFGFPGISGVQIAEAPIPEPGAAVLCISGALLLWRRAVRPW